MSDWIVSQDADFNGQATTYVNYGVANATALGLTTAQTGALTAALTAWAASFPAYLTGQQTAQSLTATKKTDRDALEAVMREIGGQLQSKPTVTDTSARRWACPCATPPRPPSRPSPPGRC